MDVELELPFVSQALGDKREERKVVLVAVGSVNERELEGDSEFGEATIGEGEVGEQLEEFGGDGCCVGRF